MTYYSLFYLIPATLENDIVTDIQNSVTKLITKRNGTIIKTDEAEKRKLSYAINNIRHGIYTNIDFNVDQSKLDLLKKDLKLEANILRFLITQEKKSNKIIKPIRHKISTKTNEAADTSEDNKPQKPQPSTDQSKEEQEKIKTVIAPITTNKSKNKPKIDLEELDKKIEEILDN